MNKKAIILLILLTLGAFSNTLLNDFVGDDHIVIVSNNFYDSWSNFPKLISSEYLTNSDEVFNTGSEAGLHSGSVAYRPVLSATYFVDTFLWKKSPLGYHLTNLIIHLICVLLVYVVLNKILVDSRVILLSSIIFAIHPIKSEAVASIGYRADSLACLLILFSLYQYIKYRSKKSSPSLLLSVLGFFLAIFTKESVIVFPAIILAYDCLIVKSIKKEGSLNYFKQTLGFILVFVFYLLVYLYVFQNHTLSVAERLGSGALEQFAYISMMFSKYAFAFVWPTEVKALPPLYRPEINQLFSFQSIIGILTFFGFIGYTIYLLRKDKIKAFFASWILFTFIPISNIIPIINPFAYRFMYLPSVGVVVFLGLAVLFIYDKCKVKISSQGLKKFIKGSFVGSLIILTIFQNYAWKNGYIMAKYMVNDYPTNSVGLLHLGIQHVQHNKCIDAVNVLNKSLDNGGDDPRIYYYLGLCHMNQDELALQYFSQGVNRYANFVQFYAGIARAHLRLSNFQQAQLWAQQGLEIKKTFSIYGYLIQALRLQGDEEGARNVVKRGTKILMNSNQQESLRKLLVEDIKNMPIDLGI